MKILTLLTGRRASAELVRERAGTLLVAYSRGRRVRAHEVITRSNGLAHAMGDTRMLDPPVMENIR